MASWLISSVFFFIVFFTKDSYLYYILKALNFIIGVQSVLKVSYSNIFAYWVILHTLVVVCRLFIKINFFEKLFLEHYQSVKQFGSRSELMFCQS